MPRRAPTLAVVTRRFLPFLGALVVAAACSGSDSNPEAAPPSAPPASTSTSAPSPSVTTTTSPTTTVPTTTTTMPTTSTTERLNDPSPLNGLPAEDEAKLDRRVIAVKIDNHPSARPQSGLQDADAVAEILVEGGITRFLALFHDNDSGYVGPIRSGRPTDAGVVRPVGTVLVIASANYWVVPYLLDRGVDIVDAHAPGFRISGRRAPHNLYATTADLRREADRRNIEDDAPKTGLFAVAADTTLQGEPASEIKLQWAQGHSVTWRWDGDGWIRLEGTTAHNWVDRDGNESQIKADVLVVIESTLFYDRRLPVLDTVGEGTALVLHNGSIVEARWSRDSIRDAFEFTDADGAPLTVPAGYSWTSIFPAGRDITWQ